MMKSIFEDFLLMLQFFTRFPIKVALPCGPKNFRRGVVFLPFIGFIIGLMQYGMINLLNGFLPSSILAAMATILPIMITGGLHVDGLGDTCDGFFAMTSDKTQIIDIMKDSGAGTYAICAIISNFILQYGAIEYMIDQNTTQGLLVIIMFSKLFVLFKAMWARPAKPQGSGNLFVGNISVIVVMIGTLYALFIGIIVISLYSSLVLILVGALFAILFNWLCYKKINGVTGDTLGATQEMTTVVMLIMYCAIIR